MALHLKNHLLTRSSSDMLCIIIQTISSRLKMEIHCNKWYHKLHFFGFYPMMLFTDYQCMLSLVYHFRYQCFSRKNANVFFFSSCSKGRQESVHSQIICQISVVMKRGVPKFNRHVVVPPCNLMWASSKINVGHKYSSNGK